MRFRFALSPQHRALVAQFQELNEKRTGGRWNPDDMVFPPGDADTLFMEFVTENADELLKLIQAYYCLE
jgi:hypothetical protein